MNTIAANTTAPVAMPVTPPSSSELSAFETGEGEAEGANATGAADAGGWLGSALTAMRSSTMAHVPASADCNCVGDDDAKLLMADWIVCWAAVSATAAKISRCSTLDAPVSASRLRNTTFEMGTDMAA